MIQRIGVKDIEATLIVHQHLPEAGPSDDGADIEREAARTGHMAGILVLAKSDRYLRPAEVSA